TRASWWATRPEPATCSAGRPPSGSTRSCPGWSPPTSADAHPTPAADSGPLVGQGRRLGGVPPAGDVLPLPAQRQLAAVGVGEGALRGRGGVSGDHDLAEVRDDEVLGPLRLPGRRARGAW